jgi:hypothetical protein
MVMEQRWVKKDGKLVAVWTRREECPRHEGEPEPFLFCELDSADNREDT